VFIARLPEEQTGIFKCLRDWLIGIEDMLTREIGNQRIELASLID
jgi:hypothetical protein